MKVTTDKPNVEKIHVHLKLPKELREKVARLAQIEYRNFQSEVLKILEEYVAANEHKLFEVNRSNNFQK